MNQVDEFLSVSHNVELLSEESEVVISAFEDTIESVFDSILEPVNIINDPTAYLAAATALHRQTAKFVRRLNESLILRVTQIREERL